MIWALLSVSLAAVGYGVSTIMQAIGARRVGGLGAVLTPLVLFGFALDGVAWLLSLLALAKLPLFVVQAIQASSLVIVVIGARFVLNVRLRRIDMVAIGVILVALAVLGMAGGEQPAVPVTAGFLTWLMAGTVLLVVAAVIAYWRQAAIPLATVAGLGYAVVAIAARAAHAGNGIWDTIVQPTTGVILAGGAVALLTYLRALEVGAVGTVAAILSVVEILVPTVVGIVWMGDRLTSAWMVPAVAATGLAIVGCWVLALSPANEAASESAPTS